VQKWIEDLSRRFPGLVIKPGEPMARHTTFRTGGPADCLVLPATRDDFTGVCDFCRNEKVPLFVIGGGSNLLVSDRGIRGVTLSTAGLDRFSIEGNTVFLGAGAVISDAALETAKRGLEGLHVFHGMPGSVGGAVYMNARCYGAEIADMFTAADLYAGGRLERAVYRPEEWDYKRSPFQKGGVILEAVFTLNGGDAAVLTAEAESHRRDREEKGHYRAPCAGSVFKNNRNFGEPSGVIIDRCGLKGLSSGGAMVSSWHANIIVNGGGATSSDIMNLIRAVRSRVFEQTGFDLEPEIIPAGDWEGYDVAGA
jgi:UDP-N-acetylmuramate dehydrogenase